VTKMPGGYDLAAQCPTKKPIPTDLIKLRFAESAGAMLVESNAIAPTGLIYCKKRARRPFSAVLFATWRASLTPCRASDARGDR
jgi:hypothetical protein